MPLEQTVEGAKKIEGFLTCDEMKFLYLAAKKFAKKGPIVEIGSWKGKSTVCLAAATKEIKGNKVFAIDPHRNSRENKTSFTLHDFKKNIRNSRLEKYVKPLVMKSEAAAKKWPKNRKVALLWIDGSHEYEDVKKDFLLWEGFLMGGGLIAFHDSYYSGPSRVINDFVIKSKKFSYIGHIDYITFALKAGAGGARFRRLYSIYFRHFLRNLMRTGHLQPKFVQTGIKNAFLKGFDKLDSVKHAQ